MRINNFLATVLLLLSTMITANFAVAAGNSIDDGFDALDKAKGGSKTTGQGIDAGFGSLDKGKGNTAAGQGVDAGFGALDKGSSKANAATGHSMDVQFQDVAAHRAEQNAKAAELQRIRMEEEAKKQDEYLASSCDCPRGENADGSCASGITFARTCYGDIDFYGHRPEISCAPMGEGERQTLAAAKAEKHRICAAWKAEGPKANSASFRAQLAQQHAVIESSKQKWEEEDRKRNEMLRAEDTKEKEQAQRTFNAKIKADQDAANSRAAAIKAKNEAAAAGREAKLRQSCMARSDLLDCECIKYNPGKVTACRK